MIPKIIHFCWFGGGEKKEIINDCIESWKTKLPDYKIIEWNESTFDVNSIPYVKEAYECKKYAFVSDYVRLYALYHYGGIYLDTDVEVKKSFDSFLDKTGVFGFESCDRIATAVMMAQKNSDLIKKWIETYANRKFIINGKMDMTPNVHFLTCILEDEGVCLNGERQELHQGEVLICEQEVFCPYAIGESKKREFINSYAVHWCEGSWVSGNVLLRHNIIRIVKRIVGKKNYEHIRGLLRKNVRMG